MLKIWCGIALAMVAQPSLSAPTQERPEHSAEAKLLWTVAVSLSDSYIGNIEAETVGNSLIDALADPKSKYGAAIKSCKRDKIGLRLGDDPIWVGQIEAATQCLRQTASAEEQQFILDRSIIIALKALDPAPRLLVVQPSADSQITAYGPAAMDQQHSIAVAQQTGSIGLSLRRNKDDGRVEVYDVNPDAAAARAGIVPGDLITSIDGRPISSFAEDQIIPSLKGPPGSFVRVTVLSKEGGNHSLSLLRAEQQFRRPAELSIIDGLAVIRLPQLVSRQSVRQVKEFVKTLNADAAKAIVLDLRYSGGELSSVVEIADLFLERGLIVAEVDRKKESEQHYAKTGAIAPRWKIFTVIDESTNLGGAALAAALSDNKRALSVGTKTGKMGSLSTLFELDSRRSLKVPSGWLVRPDGGILNDIVVPDILVQTPPNSRSDAIFSAALEEILKRLAI